MIIALILALRDRTKYWVAVFLMLAIPAWGANTPPPGSQGDIITNNGNNQYGADSLGSGLVQTTTNGRNFLSSTSTGGVSPAGALGAVQYNCNGSFCGQGLNGQSLLGAYVGGVPTSIVVGNGLGLSSTGGVTTIFVTGGGGSCPSNGIAEENGSCIITENGQYIIEE